MRKILILFMVSTILFGCKKAGNSTVAYESAGIQKTTDNFQTVERKLIKDGRIDFQTKDVEVTEKTVRAIAKQCGAWISDDHCSRTDSKLEYNLTIRVPSDKYESLTNLILKEADVMKLDSKSTSIEDVTEEYIDVKTRLEIKKDSEKKLTELLGKAKNMAEVLEVQKQLSELRENIESVEGRMKFLADQVSYSTLRVTFYVNMPYSSRFFGGFWSALKDGWEVFLYVLTGAAYLWVLILVVVLGRWGYKSYKKYHAENRE
jgi:hypothetical protein